MPRIEMTTDITSLLEFFRAETRIYGRCAHCGEPFRLSDVKLAYGREPPRDVLTRLTRERDRLTAQLADLEDQLEAHRADAAAEMDQAQLTWQLQREADVQRAIASEVKRIRAQAIAGSRATLLGKTIERIAPMFSGFGHHPGDVRALFEPIDFVVFTGLYSGEVTDLVIVEFKTGNARLSPVQRSIRHAVEQRRVRFEERRISAATLQRLAGRRMRAAGRQVIEMPSVR